MLPVALLCFVSEQDTCIKHDKKRSLHFPLQLDVVLAQIPFASAEDNINQFSFVRIAHHLIRWDMRSAGHTINQPEATQRHQGLP